MKNPMHILPANTRRIALVALVGAAGLAACNQDLIAPVPDSVLPDQIAGTAALPNAYNAVIADFQLGFAGSGTVEGIVNMSGTLSDELFNAETFPTRIEVDKRTTNPINSTMLPIFRNLQRARHTAELVEARYGAGDPTNANRAEAEALAAYTYVLLAENYCSGVPTSTVAADGITFVYGPSQNTGQLYAIALQKFDSAITLATTATGANASAALNLARVGKGRVQLDQANFAAAAATVALVPTSFAYNIQHDANTTRQNNGVFTFMFGVKRFTVSDKEGTNGLPFVTSGDTRIGAFRNGVGFDAATPEFQALKFQDRASPTPLALGTEARLIQAEAFNQAGDTAHFFAYLDSARIASKTYAVGPVGTSAGALGPIPTATRTNLAAPARIDLLFSERAFDLYLTSHRVGDMRRLIRAPYLRGSETVFPTGPYPGTKSIGNYGPDVNLPIPFEEVNNPAYTGCIDRNA